MIKKAKFLAKEASLRLRYIMEKDCIFCKIAAGKVKTKPVLETENILAFFDTNPSADIHILIIPKRHIDSVLTLTYKDSKDLIDMYKVAQKIVKDKNIQAFRMTFNGGKFQHIGHLHMHLLAGDKIDWSKL